MFPFPVHGCEVATSGRHTFQATGELYVKKTTLQFQGLGNFLTEQVA